MFINTINFVNRSVAYKRTVFFFSIVKGSVWLYLFTNWSLSCISPSIYLLMLRKQVNVEHFLWEFLLNAFILSIYSFFIQKGCDTLKQIIMFWLEPTTRPPQKKEHSLHRPVKMTWPPHNTLHLSHQYAFHSEDEKQLPISHTGPPHEMGKRENMHTTR